MFLEAPSDQTAFSGDLASIKLVDILRILNQNRSTGKLNIQNGDREGDVYFRNGDLVHAEFMGESGAGAIFDLLAWSGHRFTFFSSTPPPETTISAAVEEVLQECDLIDEEWDSLLQIVPSLDLVYAWSLRGLKSLNLNRVEWKVLQAIDGKHNIREVARELNCSELDTLRILHTFVLNGVIQVARPVKRKPKLSTANIKFESLRDKLMVFSFLAVSVPLLFLSIFLNYNFIRVARKQFRPNFKASITAEIGRANDLREEGSEGNLFRGRDTLQSGYHGALDTSENHDNDQELHKLHERYLELLQLQQKFETKILHTSLAVTLWVLAVSLAAIFMITRRLFRMAN